MNGLVLESENLNKVAEGARISRDGAFDVYAAADPGELFAVARTLRERHKQDLVTFSKKAFFNLINLCADTCSYCTYKAEPGDEKLSMMSVGQVSELLLLAKKYRCVEILFVTGERPESRYPQARRWLRENGFKSTAEYLVHASEMALNQDMFPHTNAGNLHRAEMAELRKTNVSLGLMLENVSERLAMRGMPHSAAASKRPESRLEVLRDAGRLGIPMTTGILIGIGERPEEIIESILAIRDLHEAYGNIQEVILQNFQPKQDTRMRNSPPADGGYFKRVVALSRVVMPEMNIQIPPNLSPESYGSFLSAGINDWGGISPLTPDYVNPEFSWPEIGTVGRHTNNAGFRLECRFPVYPEFIPMVDGRLQDRMSRIDDGGGLVRRGYWE